MNTPGHFRKQCDIVTLSVILNIIPIFLFYNSGLYLLYVLTSLSTLFSFLYHVTYESSKLFLYLDMSTTIICFGVFIKCILLNKYNYFYISFLTLSLYMFYLGSGRNKTQSRTCEYTMYHTIWHIMICILGCIYALQNTV